MITVLAAAINALPSAVNTDPIPARNPNKKAFLRIRKKASLAQTQNELLVIAH